LLNKYQFVPRKYLGDTTLWPLLDYIANFENLGHGEFRAIVFISPIGPNKNMWDSIPPTPFLDAILLGRNFPYYIRGGAPEDSYRRYFSLTFTKTHLISINFLGDSVAIIDAESHPNMPRYELLVSGSRNTKILGTNFALKSKVKWNELWQQNFINQGTPYWASPAAVTESEGVLQVGKNDQLNRIIQTDSSNFEFFRSVASIKNPIASVYSMESDDPTTLTTTLPAEVAIQGYKITTSNLVGQGGLIQFDGNSGQIINQNISNKQLSRVIPSNYVFPMWHYSEIYQSEKGNIYYYGHLLGGWKITISGDDTTKGQSSSNYPFPDADALLIKFGNKCGINSDTVTVAPLEPSWLSASCSDETGIVLKWDDNSHTEIGYKIYRAVNKGSYTLLCTLPANSKGYTDHLVIPASTYHYKVYSYNRIDTSFAATVSKTLCYADGTENINPLQTNGRIYPNPSATNHFTVIYNATQNETAILRVVSLNGALLYESKVAINPNANSYEVVLPSTTPAGTYLVSLIGTQTIYQDKVVLVK
jgi:hypothetical protein